MEEKIQIKTLSIGNIQQKLFWFLMGGIIVFTILYMYIVGQTILNVVDRKVSEENIKYLNSSISELQSRYIILGQDINLAYAKTLGFQDISKIIYVSRIPVLTMRDNAR